jgi:hypothetical protein
MKKPKFSLLLPNISGKTDTPNMVFVYKGSPMHGGTAAADQYKNALTGIY